MSDCGYSLWLNIAFTALFVGELVLARRDSGTIRERLSDEESDGERQVS